MKFPLQKLWKMLHDCRTSVLVVSFYVRIIVELCSTVLKRNIHKSGTLVQLILTTTLVEIGKTEKLEANIDMSFTLQTQMAK